MDKLMRFLKDEEGASLVEYALLVGLIALVVVGAVTLAGERIEGLFDYIAGALPQPPPPPTP